MVFKDSEFFVIDKDGNRIRNENPNEFMFGVKCDGCGELFGDGEYDPCLTPYEGEVLSLIGDHGWGEIDGKHYCPHCCEYDEEKECYVLVRREKGNGNEKPKDVVPPAKKRVVKYDPTQKFYSLGLEDKDRDAVLKKTDEEIAGLAEMQAELGNDATAAVLHDYVLIRKGVRAEIDRLCAAMIRIDSAGCRSCLHGITFDLKKIVPFEAGKEIIQ